MADRGDAKAIATSLLDKTGGALISGDFDAFFDCFALPHHIETFDGEALITTRAEMRERYDRVRTFMRSQAVTELVRHVIVADWLDDETIRHSHESRLLSGVTLVQAPYPNLSEIKRIDGAWKVVRSQYAISDAPNHNTALCGDLNSTLLGETND